MYDSFIKELMVLYGKGLPGAASHDKMASSNRITSQIIVPNNHRKSAVMLVLVPVNNSPHFVLIKRSIYRGVHSGQIAFPGGAVEKGDINLAYTAIRETHEEISVKLEESHIIGSLSSLYIPPSNFKVHPFMAYLNFLPEVKPQQREVDQILLVPLEDLMNDENQKIKDIKMGDKYKITAPYYDLNNQVVWGATAMMLSELKDLISPIFR